MNSIPKTQFFEPKPTPTEKLSESLSVAKHLKVNEEQEAELMIDNAPKVQSDENEKSALEFIERIRSIYADRPHIYEQFLDIMKKFKDKRVDTSSVIKI